MNLDEISATIKELESQIASYEFRSFLRQATPQMSERLAIKDKQATDSGSATSNALDSTDFDKIWSLEEVCGFRANYREYRKRREMNWISALTY